MYLNNICNRIVNLNNCVIKRNLHLIKKSAFIGGNWVQAISNKKFEVKSPYDNKVVGHVPDMSKEDCELAIKNAYDAFYPWQSLTAKERANFLRNWYNLATKHTEDLAKIMSLESGKPIVEARTEVNYGNSFIDWFAEEARRIDGEIISSPNNTKKIMVFKQPIGVVGLITPWNFPHAMIARKAGAALAAGCTCVIKPAEDTPLTALALAHLAEEAGFPKGVINVVTSDRKNAGDIGKHLCESPKIAGISFTGSTRVGKLLYQQCSSGVKRIGLELGGNAPFIVFESADVDKAVKGAVGSKFRNCGQTCVSANRFLIHDKIFDEFVEKFKNAIENLVIGNVQNDEVQIGPLINEAQAKKVHDFVQDAVSKGAKVVTGGKPALQYGKYFFEPTLLTNIKKDMIVYTEEIFGPVASCIRFKTEKEALEIANSSLVGLAGYFYSENISQIFRVAEAMEVGMIGVNEGIISTAEAPFGGVKESGLGREGSHHGVEDFINIKYVCLGNM